MSNCYNGYMAGKQQQYLRETNFIFRELRWWPDSSTDEIKKLSATCLLGYVHLWDLKSPQNMAKAPEITEKIDKSSQTIWGGRYLYQNRNVFVTFDGSGSVKILKYKYKGDSNKVQGDQTIRTGCVEKLQECQSY